MADGKFWDNAQAAQKVIGEANAIKAKLDPLKDLEQKIADLKTLKELVIEDASESAAKEFQAEFDAVAKSLDALELRGDRPAATTAVHAFTGGHPGATAALLAAITGGLMAMGYLAIRAVARRWWPQTGPAVPQSRESIPYAPAITAGVLLALISEV